MGLFDFGKKDKAIKLLSQEVQELKKLAQNRGFDSMAIANLKANFNSSIALYPDYKTTSTNERYLNSDDIYSIIRLLSNTAALVPLYGYLQTPDEKSFRKLVREHKTDKNPYRYKALQTKALADLPDNDPVAMLLENPHGDMSKYAFFEAVYALLFLFGECFILKERPDLGTNAGMPVQLHNLFPQNIILKVSTSLPRTIVAYDYRVEGKIIMADIPPSDVIHIKYFNPDMTFMGGELRGLSPIRALQKRLTRVDSAMNTSVAQVQNGGVETIVYDKSLNNVSSDEAIEITGKRKDNFYRFLSNPANAGAPYFSGGEMGSVQIGSHLKDMGLLELSNTDFKKLCNAWGVSDVLFNSSDTNSENNVQIQTKRLYTNTVLPNVYRVRDSLVKGLLPDFQFGVTLHGPDGEEIQIKGDGKKRFIDADISDISELHADLEKKAAAISTMWHLTPNEKREMMDWERYDDPKFDMPWIPAGLTPLDDFEQMPPLPVVTPNGN